MPFTKHPRVAKALGRLAAMTAFGVLASSGVAAAATCQTQATTTPFSQFGDNHNYFLVQGGSFAGSSLPAGWTANGASATTATNAGSPDGNALTIPAGGSVTTAYQCVDATMPDMRFFAKQAAAGSNLNVDVLVKLSSGTLTVPLGDLADGSMPAWAPTSALSALNGLTMPAGLTVQAALRFSVPGNSGAWELDDVYVDPYSFG